MERATEETEIATEIGFVVLRWNHLHEILRELFGIIEFDGLSDEVDLAWYSIISDRSKRERLKEAATNRLKSRTNLLDEALWLLDQINVLSERRNNAVHASYAFLSSDGKSSIIPHTYSGNPRSLKLDGKDLVREFREIQIVAENLTEFSNELYQCVNDPNRKLQISRPIV